MVIASQSGHRLPPLTVEQNKAPATRPVEELLDLPFLQPDQVTDPLHATRSPPWTPDEVGTVSALLMGPDGGFSTGSDILMDGAVTAAYSYGELAPDQNER